jgi:hypothetical protein
MKSNGDLTTKQMVRTILENVRFSEGGIAFQTGERKSKVLETIRNRR